MIGFIIFVVIALFLWLIISASYRWERRLKKIDMIINAAVKDIE